MSVLKKLMEARIKLQSTKIEKTGNNKFAGYKYMQLDDFLPATQEIFNNLGLCGVVSFHTEEAVLTITDTDGGGAIQIKSPMSTCALKGAHEIQNLGAVQTYLRRYLWVTAMEIVEHDALDSSEPIKAEPKKEAVKPPAKHVKPADSAPWKITLQSYEQGGWAGAVLEGAKMALELATTPDDVVQIFKVNRELLDQLSKEMPEEHKNLLAMFSETKTKLLGE
jgi:hypothetical protein